MTAQCGRGPASRRAAYRTRNFEDIDLAQPLFDDHYWTAFRTRRSCRTPRPARRRNRCDGAAGRVQ